MFRIVAASAAFIASVSTAGAVEILKSEPPRGAGSTMRPNTSVYVDNGKCPKGQVMKVTAGIAYGGRNTTGERGTGRTRECVPRPN